MKVYFLLLLLAMSCGKKSGGGSGSSSRDPLTDESHSNSYQFVENGCDTGKHEFKGASDRAVQEKICANLQDDEVNNGCASNLRYQFFQYKCQGMKWSQVGRTAPNQPHISVSVPSQLQNDNDKVINGLSLMLLDGAPTLASDLPKSELLNLQNLIHKMSQYGLGLFGPNCLDDSSYIHPYGHIEDSTEGKTFKINLISNDGLFPKIFVFKLDDSLNSTQLKVYSALENGSKNKLLLTAKIQSDSEEKAIQRVKESRDAEVIFYAAKTLQLLKKQKLGSEIQQIISNSLVQNKTSILSFSDSTEIQIVSLFFDSLNPDSSQKKDLGDFLLKNSTSKRIKSVVAINLFSSDSQEKLRPYVIEALKDVEYQVRLKALNLLSKIELNSDEKNAVLERNADYDVDVSSLAFQISDTLTLDLNNLPTLLKLKQNADWKVKKRALSLISKINDPKASESLVSGLNDTDPDVREESLNQLQKKSMTPELTEKLIPLASDPLWNVRKDVVSLIAKNKSSVVTKVLIEKIADYDNDVAALAMKFLRERTFDVSAVSPLENLLSSASWTIRKNAAEVLGLIKSADSMTALTKRLKIEPDQDVQEQIKRSIARLKGSV